MELNWTCPASSPQCLPSFSSVCRTLVSPLWPPSGDKPKIAQPSHLKTSHKGCRRLALHRQAHSCRPLCSLPTLKRVSAHTSRGDIYTYLWMEITAATESVQFSQNQCYLPHTERNVRHKTSPLWVGGYLRSLVLRSQMSCWFCRRWLLPDKRTHVTSGSEFTENKVPDAFSYIIVVTLRTV